jgi:hypothetical protein
MPSSVMAENSLILIINPFEPLMMYVFDDRIQSINRVRLDISRVEAVC